MGRAMRFLAQRSRSVRRRQNFRFAAVCVRLTIRREAFRTPHAVRHSVCVTLDAVRHFVRRMAHAAKHSVPELDRDNPAAAHMDNSTAPNSTVPNSTAPELDRAGIQPRRNSTAPELDRDNSTAVLSGAVELSRSSCAYGPRSSCRGRVVHAPASASRGASLVENLST